MKIEAEANDETVLAEWGVRLAQVRLRHNLTQAQVAEMAGVSKRTVERWESGSGAPQITTLLGICRVLGLGARFDAWFPDADEGSGLPVQLGRGDGGKRRRASAKSPKRSRGAGGPLLAVAADETGAERAIEPSTVERRPADLVVVAHELN